MTTPSIDEGETYVADKTPENATALLEAAEALGLEPFVVRTTQAGFIVPTEVSDLAFPPKKKPATKSKVTAEKETD